MENQILSKFANPIDYLKVFFRRKWLFIAPIFAGLVLSVMAAFMLPPTYESSTIILVEEEKIINPLIQNLAVSTSAAQRMQTIREIILGWNSLLELSKKLNLAKDIKDQLEFESFINGLRKRIEVQMRPNNTIRIAYSAEDPLEAKLVAENITEILVKRNMESQTRETDVAISFIKEQLAIYKRKIKESEVAKLEDDLKNLLVDSTEQHPMVRELRHKLEEAKKELESGEFEVAGQNRSLDEATRKVLKDELDKLAVGDSASASSGLSYAAQTSGKEDPNSSIYKLLLMDKVSSSVARDMTVNENIYNQLLQRLETAKITQRLETSRQGTHYTVLEPPRLPLMPTKPNKIKLLILGMFMGTAAGTGLVFGREFMDHSFLDVEDAKKTLELPLLGAISRLTTQEEIEKEKHKTKKWVTAALVAGSALVLIAMLYSLLKR